MLSTLVWKEGDVRQAGIKLLVAVCGGVDAW